MRTISILIVIVIIVIVLHCPRGSLWQRRARARDLKPLGVHTCLLSWPGFLAPVFPAPSSLQTPNPLPSLPFPLESHPGIRPWKQQAAREAGDKRRRQQAGACGQGEAAPDSRGGARRDEARRLNAAGQASQTPRARGQPECKPGVLFARPSSLFAVFAVSSSGNLPEPPCNKRAFSKSMHHIAATRQSASKTLDRSTTRTLAMQFCCCRSSLAHLFGIDRTRNTSDTGAHVFHI